MCNYYILIHGVHTGVLMAQKIWVVKIILWLYSKIH